MSNVIPKEQLTAYQRWELAAFESSPADSPSARMRQPGVDAAHDEDIPAALATGYPTAEALEQIHQEAWKEGHELGLGEGRKAGHEAGYAAGFAEGRLAGEAYAQRLQALAGALETEQLRQDAALAEEVLELAMTVAHQVVGAAIKHKPELILAGIKEALLSLPALNAHYRVLVHPDSAAVVREWLTNDYNHLNWKVVEDSHMEPGGFRFEGAHSELDATMGTRWREIAASLGARPDWLD